MSEELNPGAQTTPDVLESPIAEAAEAEMPNYSEMTLAELSQQFEELAASEDRMKKSKEAEAIKAAFYKRLSKEKAANGEEPDPAIGENVAEDAMESSQEVAGEPSPEAQPTNPFSILESGFKAIYMRYKKERAEYNRQQEAEREDNLKKKQAVIEDLKALV